MARPILVNTPNGRRSGASCDGLRGSKVVDKRSEHEILSGNPTGNFTILEPQNRNSNLFHEVGDRQVTNCQASKLWNDRSDRLYSSLLIVSKGSSSVSKTLWELENYIKNEIKETQSLQFVFDNTNNPLLAFLQGLTMTLMIMVRTGGPDNSQMSVGDGDDDEAFGFFVCYSYFYICLIQLVGLALGEGINLQVSEQVGWGLEEE